MPIAACSINTASINEICARVKPFVLLIIQPAVSTAGAAGWQNNAAISRVESSFSRIEHDDERVVIMPETDEITFELIINGETHVVTRRRNSLSVTPFIRVSNLVINNLEDRIEILVKNVDADL